MNLDELRSESSTLPNGLRVLAVHLPGVHSSVISAQLNVGSRFEEAKNNGISHFLEHMVYRGTPNYPSAHELSVGFESLGGTLMASTSADTGAMEIQIPPSSLVPILDIFSEVMRTPVFDGIEIERGIVSEEILEGLDDDGNPIDADNLIRSAVFDGHPLGMPITGTLEHLRGFTKQALAEHHQRFYTGGNMVVAVAGPDKPDVVLRALEQCFQGMPEGAPPTMSCPGAARGSSFTHAWHSSSQTELRVGFRAPAWSSPHEPAMEMLVRLLDDGMATRLYHRICDQQGLCYDVSGLYETYADVGLVELAASSAHDRAAQVLEQLLSIITELRDQGPGEQELELAKRRHRWQLEQLPDSPEAVAEFFALEELSGTARRPAQRQQQVDAVSTEAIVQVARECFRPENLSVVAVGALKKNQAKALEKLVRSFS